MTLMSSDSYGTAFISKTLKRQRQRSASVSTCSRFPRQEGVGGAYVTKNRPRKTAVSTFMEPTLESLSWPSVTLCYLVSYA